VYDLSGKVCLVTGAAGRRGMGRAIAVRLAAEGADVVVNDKFLIPPREQGKYKGWRGLESVVEEIEALGRQALAIKADVSSSRQVNEMVAKAFDRFGRIDILVNNAGISGAGRIHTIDLEDKDWARFLSAMLNSSFLCSKAVGKQMVKKKIKGKIIMIDSVCGKIGLKGDVGYDVAKFGVLGLTQVLALELAPHGINVNAVCPGLIQTDQWLGELKKRARIEGISIEEMERQFLAPLKRLIPLGRPGKPEEIANMVAFLASSESDYITGQAINVCGGWVMGR
jgi:meso-butanediol dehydrogenase/(S,S)-butanediol dehydrogenase/diacetyl reductase